MRPILLAAALFALVTPSGALAKDSIASPEEIILIQTSSGNVALVWSPVAGATGYVVYRGSSPDALQPVEIVSTPFYISMTPSPDVQWYGIAATDGTTTSEPNSAPTGPQGQDCISTSGSQVTVNSHACVGKSP